MISAKLMRDTLRKQGDPKIAEHSTRFFKAGPGEYGEGDRFLGIRVPVLRKNVRGFRGAPLRAITALLKSPRTMLRYAIEKIPEALRKAYLNGAV